MRAKQFSTTALSLIMMLVGVFGVVQLQAPVVNAQEESNEQQSEVVEDSTEFTLPDGYTYTVQPGDGVTNLILDVANEVGADITPAEAYDIARNRGSVFLDADITEEVDAPYTRGIGGFTEPGVEIASSDFTEIFDGVVQGVSTVAQGEAVEPSAEAETDELGNDSSSAANEDGDSESEEADETASDDGSEDDDGVNPLVIGLGVLGIAAIAYYLFGRSEQ